MKRILVLMKNSIVVLWKRHHFLVPPTLWGKYIKSFFIKLFGYDELLNPFVQKDYNIWLKQKNNKNTNSLQKEFENNPLISFIIPVYNIEKGFLEDCLNSILAQAYNNFEICLADDCSTKQETIDTLKEYEEKDKRVKVIYRKKNGHISKATNSALEIATGDYIALMDDDDVITENALYEMVKVINEEKADFIYSDEDKMNMDGTLCEPHFKADFSLDSFFGGNFICHFTIIKRELLDKIGYFNEEYVGAQDFDLFLRATENAKKIVHVPKILYHWRKVPGSTADTVENKEYAIENGKKAVEAALKRRKLDAYVTVPIKCTHYIVHYNLKEEPLVSLIMLDCNKDYILNNIELLKKTNYSNYEIIVNAKNINNINLKKTNNVRFTYNKNINEVINICNGEVIVFLSGKVYTKQFDWLKELVSYSIQKEIGVVAPKLIDFDGIVKSAGLILSNNQIYINAFQNYFSDSTGLYGRLLVPYNYSAFASQCIAFEKKKYLEVNKYMNNVDIEISNIDFCLKMLKAGYRNVLLSYIGIKQKDYKKCEKNDISENDKNKLRKNWDLNKDYYYNSNLSRNISFMLDKGEKHEK